MNKLEKLLEEIRIIRGDFPEKRKGISPKNRKHNYHKNRSIGRYLPYYISISRKVNQRLKEIYTPEFLKKIYQKVGKIYLEKEQRNDFGGSALVNIDNNIILRLLNKGNLNKARGDTAKMDELLRPLRPQKIMDYIDNTIRLNTSSSRKKAFDTIIHEIQHIIEDRKFNFTEFTHLKRRIIILFKKYGMDLFLKNRYGKYDYNHFINEMLTTFVSDTRSYTSVGYDTWNKLGKIKNFREFKKELKEVIKEAKIFRDDFVNKKIEEIFEGQEDVNKEAFSHLYLRRELEELKKKYPNIPYEIHNKLNNVIISKKNGAAHSYGNNPAFISYYSSSKKIRVQIWYKNGLRHREKNLPALITYYRTGEVEEKEWNTNGLRNRDGDKPSYILYFKNGKISEKGYFKNDKLHRDNDRPAVIEYDKNGKIKEKRYFKDGKEYKPNQEEKKERRGKIKDIKVDLRSFDPSTGEFKLIP